MRVPPRLALLITTGLVLAGCDTSSVDPEPAPTVTVTATEYVEVPGTGATDAPIDACAAFTAGQNHAFVFVTSPTPGAMVQSGFTFAGCSNSFEAAYNWRLRDVNGAVLASGFGTATCGTGCVGSLQQSVAFTVNAVQVGSLEVFTTSAEDGSEQDLNMIPLVLQP